MSILYYTLLFFLVFAGGLSFYLFKNIRQHHLKLSLSFSGAYLFTLTITHLIPEVYANSTANAGVYILGGFLLQLLLEFFSEGIEHGHTHADEKHRGILPVAALLSLGVHSFMEGMPLSGGGSEAAAKSMLAGIIMHHIPVAFALASMLSTSSIRRKAVIPVLAVFAAMTPMGALTNVMLIRHFELQEISLYYSRTMAFVTGIFLHISTTILFESGEEHRFNLYKMAVIIIGVLSALLSLGAFPG